MSIVELFSKAHADKEVNVHTADHTGNVDFAGNR